MEYADPKTQDNISEADANSTAGGETLYFIVKYEVMRSNSSHSGRIREKMRIQLDSNNTCLSRRSKLNIRHHKSQSVSLIQISCYEYKRSQAKPISILLAKSAMEGYVPVVLKDIVPAEDGAELSRVFLTTENTLWVTILRRSEWNKYETSEYFCSNFKVMRALYQKWNCFFTADDKKVSQDRVLLRAEHISDQSQLTFNLYFYNSEENPKLKLTRQKVSIEGVEGSIKMKTIEVEVLTVMVKNEWARIPARSDDLFMTYGTHLAEDRIQLVSFSINNNQKISSTLMPATMRYLSIHTRK